jgi:tripartite-type tricarboxylate transporter receptor subunit TctC
MPVFRASKRSTYEEKMMLTRNVTTALALLAAATAAVAQDKFPTKPIRMLVPFSAGSATDFFARAVGQKMSEAWGQQVVVDNRPSAGGVIASELLLNATPDGHTLMMVSIGHAVNASLYSKLPYDTVKDFAGVTLVADVPNVLVATPALGFKSVKDLIDLAKSKPGQINYGSAGVGSGTHMNGEEFKLAAGINVVHVPFKGTPEALTNTIGGSVQYFFAPITAAVPLVKSGRITGLAVTTKSRSPVLPDLPTVSEAALRGFDFNLWTGLLGPVKMPKDVKEKIAREVVRILALPDVKERLLTQGATPHTMPPAEFDAFIRVEVERLAKVVKASGARAD